MKTFIGLSKYVRPAYHCRGKRKSYIRRSLRSMLSLHCALSSDYMKPIYGEDYCLCDCTTTMNNVGVYMYTHRVVRVSIDFPKKQRSRTYYTRVDNFRELANVLYTYNEKELFEVIHNKIRLQIIEDWQNL